jgi:pimeloyl-ACP methyl ester carboxylesterase
MSVGYEDIYWTAPDGMRLHARDYPAAGSSDPGATPAICIHGLTRNARDFEDVAPRLAALGRRTLAVDVRGRGLSGYDPNPANYAPGVYAHDIAALLDAAEIERAVFVGTSMGGIITMVLGAVRPAAIAGTLLNDIGPEVSPVGLARIGGHVGGRQPAKDWAAAAATVQSINTTAFPDFGQADWDAFARRTYREGPDGRPVADYDPNIAAGFKPDPDAPPPPPPDMWPLFRLLMAAGPIALVRGALSDLLTAEIAAKMRAAAPALIYAEVPRVGHAPMLTEPAAWPAIVDLLARVP